MVPQRVHPPDKGEFPEKTRRVPHPTPGLPINLLDCCDLALWSSRLGEEPGHLPGLGA